MSSIVANERATERDSKNGWLGIHHAWWVVFAAGVIYLVQSGVAGYITGLLQTAWLAEFDWPATWLSLAYAGGSLLPGLAGVQIGRWTDRYGPRWVLLGGTAFTGLSYLLLAWVQSFPAFCLVFAIGALGRCGLSHIPVSAAIVRWFAAYRSRGLGLASTGISMAGILLVPLTTWLILSYGWRGAVVILGVGMWVVLLPIIWFIMGGSPAERKILPYGAGVVEAERRQGSGREVALDDARRDPTFWLVAIGQMLAMSLTATIGIHGPKAILDKGGTAADAAAMLSLMATCSLIARFGSSWIGDLLPPALSLAVLFVFEGLGFSIFALSGPGPGIWLFAIIVGLCLGLSQALRATVVADLFGVQSYGAILGAITLPSSLISAGSPVYAAIIRDLTGSFTLANLTFAASSLLGAGCLFLAHRRSFRRSP